MEDQPKELDPKDIIFSANPKPLDKPDKPFNGIAIGGIFMSPNPELTTERQEDLREKIRNIQQHRN